MSEEQLIQTPCVFGENGNYLLERELGKGGMGGVYMGRDKMLDRPVAVKVMLREYGSNAEFVEKFKKEAQAAARLIHPNIAQIYSYGISDGLPYIAMELVAGGSLDKLMANAGANIDVPRVVKICEQVAQALRCAADQGFVHGDVKPENILLDANGNAKLVDFGLAAMQKDTKEIWGTPYYIAPEKVRKEPVDYRADIYSLGGTLYHALTGVAPFEGDDAIAVVRKRFDVVPAKPSAVRPGLSPQIDALVMKMLAFDPAERYPSFEALLEDFKAVMTTGLGATQPIAGGASAGSKAGSSHGGKKIVLKPKRKLTLNRRDEDGAEPQDGGEEPSREPEEDEEEGGVGAKIAMVVGALVLVVGLVAGGLWWMQKANKSSNEKEATELVEKGISDASASLASTRQATVDVAKQVAEMSADVMKECGRMHSEMSALAAKVLPPEVVAMMKPPKSQEAAAAVAEAAGAKGAADAKPAEAEKPADGAKPAEGAKPDEKAKPAEAAKADAPKAAEQAAEAAVDVPGYVRKVAELWERAYASEAAANKVKADCDALLADIDKAAQVAAHDEAEMRRLAAATTEMRGRFDSIKGSKEIETVRKAHGTMKVSSDRLIKDTSLLIERRVKQTARDEAKKRREQEETERRQQEAASHAKKVEADVAAVDETFQSLIDNGNIRQLDWEGCRRRLKFLAEGGTVTTGEGKVRLDSAIKRIDAMDSAQKILVANMKGFTFKKSKLREFTVTDADAKKITAAKKGGAPKEVNWVSFYKGYAINLDEVFTKYIRHGRVNASPRLSRLQHAEAMLGFAMTLGTICSEDPNVQPYVEKIVKEAVKAMPGVGNMAKEMFPSIDLSEIAAEASAEEL